MKGIPARRVGCVTVEPIETEAGQQYYRAKKEHDMAAARATVARCIEKHKNEIVAVAKQYPKAKVIPMGSVTSKNCLPQALAEAIGLPVWKLVIQDKKYNHTGMGREARLFDKPHFVGRIQKGQEYVIADDVMTSGNSIKALTKFIEERGGKVVDVVVLSSRWGKSLVPDQEQIQKFEDTFTEEQRKNIYKMLDVKSAEDMTPFQIAQLRGMKYNRILCAYENYKNSQKNT